MKNSFFIFLLFLALNASAFGQEAPQTRRHETGAGYGTRDATVLSMMGWGLGLAVGIAVLCGSLSHEGSNSH